MFVRRLKSSLGHWPSKYIESIHEVWTQNFCTAPPSSLSYWKTGFFRFPSSFSLCSASKLTNLSRFEPTTSELLNTRHTLWATVLAVCHSELLSFSTGCWTSQNFWDAEGQTHNLKTSDQSSNAMKAFALFQCWISEAEAASKTCCELISLEPSLLATSSSTFLLYPKVISRCSLITAFMIHLNL